MGSKSSPKAAGRSLDPQERGNSRGKQASAVGCMEWTRAHGGVFHFNLRPFGLNTSQGKGRSSCSQDTMYSVEVEEKARNSHTLRLVIITRELQGQH